MEIVDAQGPIPAAAGEFLFRCHDPGYLGYHHPDYQAMLTGVLGDEIHHLILQRDDGSIVGYLPYRLRNGCYGAVINALPFYGPNGAVLTDPAEPYAADLLLGALAHRMRAPDIVSGIFYTPFLGDIERCSRQLHPDERLRKFTHYLDLETLKTWPPKRLADVKRARTAGFTVRPAKPEDLERLIDLHASTAEVAGFDPKPTGYTKATLEIAVRQPEGVVSWLVAERDGHIDAALMTLNGPSSASYVMPIVAADARSSQPIALLIDEAVATARRRKIRYFNFESSPGWDTPVARYKERWGALVSFYELLMVFPKGRDMLKTASLTDFRKAYPYYFVFPVGGVRGSLPHPTVE